MTETCEVVITGPSEDFLIELTKTLIEERLAACGQHLSLVRSVYRWGGKVHDEPEARVMLHTRMALVPEIIDATRKVHPYEVPCVLALPIQGANPDYLEWILAETRAPL